MDLQKGAILCLVVVLFAGCGGGEFGMEGATVGDDSDAEESRVNTTEVRKLVYKQVVEFRNKENRRPINYHSELSEFAQKRSEAIATSSDSQQTLTDEYKGDCDWGDEGSDEYGLSQVKQETYFGIELSNGDHYTTEAQLATGIVDVWKNSNGTRKLLLENEWKYAGVGVTVVDEGDRYTVYVVQLLC